MDGLNGNWRQWYLYSCWFCWVSMVRRHGTRRAGRGKCLLPRQPPTIALFRRPKLTLSCSAERKEGRKYEVGFSCSTIFNRNPSIGSWIKTWGHRYAFISWPLFEKHSNRLLLVGKIFCIASQMAVVSLLLFIEFIRHVLNLRNRTGGGEQCLPTY
jgi:hypothetical protein